MKYSQPSHGDTSDQGPFFTPQFALVCLSNFLFFLSFNMILPELPAFLESMGGAAYKGGIIGLFTLTAALSRPFSGRFADSIGRKPVIFFGIAVSAGCCLVYPWAANITLFLLLRLVHGFSTGFTPTGTSAYMADIIPAGRRGEAMGVFGLLSSLGMALGPAVGSWLAQAYSLEALFYVSAGVGGLSLLLVLRMAETLPQRQPFSVQMLALSRADVFEPSALSPAVVYGLSFFSYGVMLTVVPDVSVQLGIANKGLFFSVTTIASLGVRFVAGKSSDRYGREVMLMLSSGLMAAGMLVAALATAPPLFFVSAVLLGFALGIVSPTVIAWTVDLSTAERRGQALATMYIALEVGIGTGAFAAGLFAKQMQRLPLLFALASLCGVASLVYLLFLKRRK